MQSLLTRTMPATAPPHQTSTLAPYREEVAAYRARGREMAAIRGRLEEQHGHPVSYAAVRRLVGSLEPPRIDAVVRVEVTPGSEARVDFGYAGLTLDPATGQPRTTWVFVLVLSWSRHLYAELVFDQGVETWLLCHRHAFEAWGGVPRRIVPDNLKAAIVRASFTEPLAPRAYREGAEHYGFLIDPHPPRTPQHKGKVEQGGVHDIKRNVLAGRDPAPTDALNRTLRRGIMETAGRRVHGITTTTTLETFDCAFTPAINRQQVYDLATRAVVREHRNVLIRGQTGVGKSHLSHALAHEAARQDYDILFTAAHQMLVHINAGRADGTAEKRLAVYTKPHLLVIDDFGLKPLPPSGPADLYDVINERYERASIVLTSNRAPGEWPDLCGNPLLASAGLDRLAHRASVLTITGRSYRLAQRADGAGTARARRGHGAGTARARRYSPRLRLRLREMTSERDAVVTRQQRHAVPTRERTRTGKGVRPTTNR